MNLKIMKTSSNRVFGENILYKRGFYWNDWSEKIFKINAENLNTQHHKDNYYDFKFEKINFYCLVHKKVMLGLTSHSLIDVILDNSKTIWLTNYLNNNGEFTVKWTIAKWGFQLKQMIRVSESETINYSDETGWLKQYDQKLEAMRIEINYSYYVGDSKRLTIKKIRDFFRTPHDWDMNLNSMGHDVVDRANLELHKKLHPVWRKSVVVSLYYKTDNEKNENKEEKWTLSIKFDGEELSADIGQDNCIRLHLINIHRLDFHELEKNIRDFFAQEFDWNMSFENNGKEVLDRAREELNNFFHQKNSNRINLDLWNDHHNFYNRKNNETWKISVKLDNQEISDEFNNLKMIQIKLKNVFVISFKTLSQKIINFFKQWYDWDMSTSDVGIDVLNRAILELNKTLTTEEQGRIKLGLWYGSDWEHNQLGNNTWTLSIKLDNQELGHPKSATNSILIQLKNVGLLSNHGTYNKLENYFKNFNFKNPYDLSVLEGASTWGQALIILRLGLINYLGVTEFKLIDVLQIKNEFDNLSTGLKDGYNHKEIQFRIANLESPWITIFFKNIN